MEPVLYIVIALLLAFGPALGFYFGAKCAAHLFGIDLQPGDTLRAARWDEMPEIYRPDPADDDAQEAPLEQAGDAEPADEGTDTQEEPPAPETPGGTVLREPLAGPWVRQQLGPLAGPVARMTDNYAAVLTGAAAAGALALEERPEPDNIELVQTMTPPAPQGEET